jgi:regulator of protease activity HflC (stomatin/prohibitin superfamily)
VNQLFTWLADLFKGAKPWVIVLAWERGVRVRFGNRTTVLEPGLHWRIPFFDEIRTLNNRLRVAAFPCVTVSTRDGRAVTISGNVAFRITDPKAALLAMSEPGMMLAAVAQSVCARLISAADSVQQLEAPALEASAVADLREFAAGKGIEVEFFRLVDFVVVRALRLLQEEWRPRSNEDAGHS